MTRRWQVLMWVLASLAMAAPALAQSAEDLYGAGAFRPAADSFAARVSAEPEVPAHWYNLGNALYRAGDRAGARVAWLRAARLAPRDRMIQQALKLVPPPDANSAAASAVSIVTPGEALLVGAILWVFAWILVAFRRPLRYAAPFMVAGLIVLMFGAGKTERYTRPVALVRRDNTSLRAAPFPSATSRRAMTEGATVEVLRRYAGWVLVRRGNDRGWVQRAELVPLGGVP
ncbi:MAG: hypothetical protein HY700_09305 [Gemmatimonadetes bacterium]|nr:hypothetical protein [Gemmatimonadota bacterium]